MSESSLPYYTVSDKYGYQYTHAPIYMRSIQCIKDPAYNVFIECRPLYTLDIVYEEHIVYRVQ